MPPNSARTVAIIGGGISGLTTAILLQISGYRTTIYTQLRPDYRAEAIRPPAFATPHAAASIIPHSVASPHITRWTGISQAFFRTLCFPGRSGVRSQRHYEVFEDPVATPDYADVVQNFQLLRDSDPDTAWSPRRTGAQAVHGWKFDTFFCDAPEYLAYLDELYAATGGRVQAAPGDGALAAYLALNHDHYVNCAGIGAYRLLADSRLADAPAAPDFVPLIDPVPARLIRGHYLRMNIKRVPAGFAGRCFSYDYKPNAEIYPTATGAAADVYCYPRSDAWILGGSRQQGAIDADGNWTGEDTVAATLAFARPDAAPIAIPAPILTLNSDILHRMTAGDLDLEALVRDDPSIATPAIGYRFVRDSQTDSVRLDCSRVDVSGTPKYLLHNYGHGGAGFTLSWGCAFDILQRLRRLIDPTESFKPGRFALHHAAMQQMLADLTKRLQA